MHRKLKKIYRIISLILIFICLFSTFIFVIFDKCLGYQTELYARQITANKINGELSKIINLEIQNLGITYDSIINIEKSSDGKLSAIKADMVDVTLLKDKLSQRVSEFCSENNFYVVEIPVGSLIGKGLFYGKGFNIRIKFRPLGAVSSKMTGDFYEAGINQTVYRISFDINVNAVVVFPFRYVEVPINCETVIAETVIIGDVPDSFTHFDLEGDITSQDFQGYVEDYMAE